jgi:peptidyl-prolyl cis-trans isomerase A (cyclophilin A)
MKSIFLTFGVGLCLFAQTTATKRPATAARRPAGVGSLMNPASLKATAPEVYKAKFTTTKGDFVVEVHRSWAPLGADRFYNLVRAGFFTDASFFRVIPNFMAQFGISAKPAIAKVWESNAAKIKDDPTTQSNKRGYITFATAGPNTRTTQVFINFKDNTFLDTQGFAPFGTVVDGMDVVDKLYSGYGDGPPEGKGPAQDKIQAEGKPYLDKGFPQLDSIKSAVITEPAGAAPAAHKTATTAKPATKQ